MTDGANPRRQPAEDRQTGMNLMQHGEEEQVYCIETIKSDGDGQCVGARKGMSEKGEECFLPNLRAWTQMGKEIKEERIEYKREGAMSFRAVANQTNGRRKARQKGNER